MELQRGNLFIGLCIGGIALLIAIISLSLLLTPHPQAKPVQQTATPIPLSPHPSTSVAGHSTPMPTSPPLSTVTYNAADHYSITYPRSLQQKLMTVVGGGTLVSFSGALPNGTENFPRIDIQETPLISDQTRQQVLQTLSALRLQQTTTQFHTYQAIQFSGTLPFLFPVNNTPTSATKTFLLFNTNDTSYVIDYGYYNDANAATNKQLLETTLQTLVFK